MQLEVDCTGAEIDAVPDLIRRDLTRLHGANSSGRPMIVRADLVGELTGSGTLHDRASALRDEVRAIATSVSADLHVEKVRVRTGEPAGETHAIIGEDLGALIAEGASDPELVSVLQTDLDRFMIATTGTLGDPEEGELRLSATQGDWPTILRMASLALQSRLTREV